MDVSFTEFTVVEQNMTGMEEPNIWYDYEDPRTVYDYSTVHVRVHII